MWRFLAGIMFVAASNNILARQIGFQSDRKTGKVHHNSISIEAECECQSIVLQTENDWTTRQTNQIYV